MQKVARFYKVSEKRFAEDWCALTKCHTTEASTIYERIQIPCRATVGSAGYDFFAPESFSLVPSETISIPTGIRAEIAEGWILQLYPRSSLGFKYRLQMDNTVGIIDSDYCTANNEGHIFIKMTNCSTEGKVMRISAGERFAQGIFIPFGITEDDNTEGIRIGGIGSTGE